MRGLEKPAMRIVLSQQIEHSNWASRSCVDATMDTMGEAIREPSAGNRDLARCLDRAESAMPGADERDRVLLSTLESLNLDEELRALCVRFMKLREKFRPIWSAELSGSVMKFPAAGRLVAVHRR